MLAEAAIIWRLDWSWRLLFWDGAFPCCWPDASVPTLQTSASGLLGILTTQQLASPTAGKSERERGGNLDAFYILISESMHLHFHGIPIIRSKSPNAAHTWGEWLHLWREACWWVEDPESPQGIWPGQSGYICILLNHLASEQHAYLRGRTHCGEYPVLVSGS